jgi:hypothetical protein
MAYECMKACPYSHIVYLYGIHSTDYIVEYQRGAERFIQVLNIHTTLNELYLHLHPLHMLLHQIAPIAISFLVVGIFTSIGRDFLFNATTKRQMKEMRGLNLLVSVVKFTRAIS